jgi:hypothetical protein
MRRGSSVTPHPASRQVFASSTDALQPPDSTAGPVVETITKQLGNAAIIPMRFGGGPDAGQHGIRAWIEKTGSDGLA